MIDMKEMYEMKKLRDIPGVAEWLPYGTDLDAPIAGSLQLDKKLDLTPIERGRLEQEHYTVRCLGATALTYACANKLSGLVKLLLDNGVNPNLPDCLKEEPLAISMSRGDLDSMRFLLKKNISLKSMRSVIMALTKVADSNSFAYSNINGNIIKEGLDFDIRKIVSSTLGAEVISKTQQVLLSYVYENMSPKEIGESIHLGKDVLGIVEGYVGLDFMSDIFLEIGNLNNLQKRIFILRCKEANLLEEKNSKLELLCQLPMSDIEEMLKTTKSKALTPAFDSQSSSSSSSSSSISASTQNDPKLQPPTPK